jgi:alkylation response protein AidB-like acyl-CoA dehydrogenase
VLTLTERQRLIRRTAAEFARRELAPDAAMRDRERRWDSLGDRARFTPHSAFELPETPADAAPRESIEVRTLAIFEP